MVGGRPCCNGRGANAGGCKLRQVDHAEKRAICYTTLDDPVLAWLQRRSVSRAVSGLSKSEATGMDESTYLNVTPRLAIPRAELSYRASRAGGPGGQHVNTSSTRIELLWDLNGSTVIDDAQRERLRIKLRPRLDSEGNVRVVASDRRSQKQNRLAAEERLAALVRHALVVPKKRRPTKPTRAAKERRLAEKKRRSEKKRERRADDAS